VIAATFGTMEVLAVVAIVVLLFVLVFLAVAETPLNRISRVKAQSLAETNGSKSAQALYRLVSTPERFINPVLVIVTFCQIGQAFLTSLLAARLFGVAGVIVAFFVNVVVFFVLSEAMPKTFAVLRAERAALATARLTEVIVTFPPLALLSRALIGITNVLLPGRGLKQGPFVSEQELLGIVGAAAEDEVIEHEERQLIESIIEFGDTVAREIMVPRPDMVTVNHEASVSAALDIAIEHGFSRLPILGGGDDDDVIGLAYAKDLMRVEREGGGDGPVTELMRPVRFIPENKAVARLMREMQAEKFHLALVADEYGAVAGLVSLEDCLEELVGEIVDEYDDEVSAVQIVGEGEYLVDGGLGISDLNELLSLALPDEDWDTLGGFVFGTLEHVPEEGETVEFMGWTFVVEQVEGRRVRQVRATAPARTAHAGDGERDLVTETEARAAASSEAD
jgi:CBS domain containing-hemolysin-like protein